ncbi:MAG: hypothetical protein IJ506_05245 [Clostridia bacterium]|nr:hypothetical protein [Clostridia bacterium]
MMKSKFLACTLASVLSACALTSCDAGVTYVPEEKDDTSYLYIQVYQGGVGSAYLENVGTAFETAYNGKDGYFAEGKSKVDVVVTSSTSCNGNGLFTNIANNNNNLFVAEGMYYLDLAASNLLYDLTDIMDDTLSDGKTIESKLYEDQQEMLTVKEDKYFSLPTFAITTGITIDAEILEAGLYFADEGGNDRLQGRVSTYTGQTYKGRYLISSKTDKKSPGPDGEYDTYDDGYPSTYEEFFYLLDCMVQSNIHPMLFTGQSTHYTNYIFQSLLSANSTKDELKANFSFDSKGNKVKVVTGFEGDQPTISEEVITEANGYLTTQQYNRYLALKFLSCLFNNKSYYMEALGHNPATLGNTEAQKVYEESKFNAANGHGKRIAMLVEGAYWYNEAKGELVESAGKFEGADNRNFAYMPLPSKETGTVNEKEGKTVALADALDYYLVANNNIKGNAEKEKLVREFVKFMYSDAQLQNMTVDTGIPFALKYDLTDAQYEGLDNYKQSLWDAYKYSKDNGTYVTPMSDSLIFLNNTDVFSFKTTNRMFHSYVNGVERNNAYAAFTQYGVSAKDYFKGMWISSSDWSSKYLGA